MWPVTSRLSFKNRAILFSLLVTTSILSLSNHRQALMQASDRPLQSLFSKAPDGYIHDFVVSREEALLATSRGLFVYKDAAWRQLTEEETFAVAAEGARLLAATRAGVMVSEDGGANWRASNKGLCEGLLPLTIQFAPGNSKRVYIGTDRHGLFRSDDGAETWYAAGEGLPHSIGAAPFAAIKRLAVAPNNFDLLFASTDAHGIYLSRDGGRHWQEAPLSLPGPFFHRVTAPFVAFDEASPEIVYALVNFPIHSHLIEQTIQRSTDGGEHWTLVRKLDPIAECGMRNADYQIPQSAIHNRQLYGFKVRDGVATILTADGVRDIDLKTDVAKEAEPSPTALTSVTGTDPDFDDENVSVLHDDGMLFDPHQSDLTGFGALVARRFYQRHDDSYDIIIAFADGAYNTSTGGLVSVDYNSLVYNYVEGIGLGQGNFHGGPAAYGSNGRLRSFCNMNNIAVYPDDPRLSFQNTNCGFDLLGHEVAHTWGAYLYFDDNGFTSDMLLGRARAHWSFFFNSEASDLEGNAYQDMGGGFLRTIGATSVYNRLDRYSMGLASPFDQWFYFINRPTKLIPNIINGQTIDPTRPEARALEPVAPPELPSILVEGDRQNVNLSQIKKVEGERSPAPPFDQSRFSMAFVYVVPPGLEPTPADLARAKRYCREWAGYFSEITDGLATVDTTLLTTGGTDTTPPDLTLTYPNGGEEIFGENGVTITWNSNDANGIARQDIALSLDGGASYPIVIASKLNGNTKSFSCTFPPGISSDQARIQITALDYAGNRTVDVSDKTFTIKRDLIPPTVKIDQPKGGEQIVAGTGFEIIWHSADNGVIQSQDINLSSDGGKTYDLKIASGLPGNAQSFLWHIPDDLKVDEALIEVLAKDTAGNVGRGVSDQPFKILVPFKNPPEVHLITAVGGELLQAGSNFTIVWSSSDTSRLIAHELALSTDGGRNFDLPIASGLAATAQSFVWRVPDQEIPNARVRITAIDEQNNRGTDSSRSDLIITRRDVTPPVVKVFSPNGGEVAQVGRQLVISWQTTDNVGVKSQWINLSLDGGKNFSIPVSGELASNISSFTFTIPNSIQPTNQARIEVAAIDTSGLTGRDSSDGDFTIEAKDQEPPKVTLISPNGGEVVASSDQLRVLWRSSDNVGVVSHDLQLSTDGGATFRTLLSGLTGDTQEALIDVGPFLSERAKAKIIARDAGGNTGTDESDGTFVIAQRPSISKAGYNEKNKKLLIFASGVSASTVVEINGQTVAGVEVKYKAVKGALVLKADPVQLNLHTGENFIVVKERGLVSTAFRLFL